MSEKIQIKLKCKECGEILEPDANFCHACGLPLETERSIPEQENISGKQLEKTDQPALKTQVAAPNSNSSYKILIMLVSVLLLVGAVFALWPQKQALPPPGPSPAASTRSVNPSETNKTPDVNTIKAETVAPDDGLTPEQRKVISERFEVHENTIKDKKTGFYWMKNADYLGHAVTADSYFEKNLYDNKFSKVKVDGITGWSVPSEGNFHTLLGAANEAGFNGKSPDKDPVQFFEKVGFRNVKKHYIWIFPVAGNVEWGTCRIDKYSGFDSWMEKYSRVHKPGHLWLAGGKKFQNQYEHVFD